MEPAHGVASPHPLRRARRGIISRWEPLGLAPQKDLFSAGQTARPSVPAQVPHISTKGLRRRETVLVRVPSRTGPSGPIRRLDRIAETEGLDRPRQAALRRPGASVSLPGALHPSRRHLQRTIAPYGGRPVRFRWRDSKDHNQIKEMSLDAVEFMRLFLLHVLPSGFVKIRHFGFLSNRTRESWWREAGSFCRRGPRHRK